MTEIFVGLDTNGNRVSFDLCMANRHGIIAGATGTGKTVTLQSLTEQFSRAGVPVFIPDVKGDLSGIAFAGEKNPKIEERVKKLKLSGFTNRGYPALFWDLFGQGGHPIRTTVSEFGPLLLSRLFELSDAQSGVLQIAFRLADEQGLFLLDLDDLKAMLAYLSENSKEISAQYGNVTLQTVAAIQRAILTLEESGGQHFFGEPALQFTHLMQKDFSGNGVISVLDARKLITDRRLYSTFLVWLLAELFEELDEIGDQEKPRIVFFFDEAHLLFADAPRVLIEKIEQVVKLIRSKGVGVYFVTQNPTDIPDSVLAQLGNRIQHALRAFTPNEQKAVKVAAQSFRPNPALDTAEVITQLGIGEALVSVLDGKGAPTIVKRTLIAPPESRLGQVTDQERSVIISRSPILSTYENRLNRESACEMLAARKQRARAQSESAELSRPSNTSVQSARSQRQGPLEAFAKSMIRSIGSRLGTQIVRGILGSMKIR